MVQRNLEQQDLHDHHEKGLYKQRTIESCTGVVEYPVKWPNVSIDRETAVDKAAERTEPRRT